MDMKRVRFFGGIIFIHVLEKGYCRDVRNVDERGRSKLIEVVCVPKQRIQHTTRGVLLTIVYNRETCGETTYHPYERICQPVLNNTPTAISNMLTSEHIHCEVTSAREV